MNNVKPEAIPIARITPWPRGTPIPFWVYQWMCQTIDHARVEDEKLIHELEKEGVDLGYKTVALSPKLMDKLCSLNP